MLSAIHSTKTRCDVLNRGIVLAAHLSRACTGYSGVLRAERRITEIRAKYLERTILAWRGHEREFLVELVRGLDEAAFAFTMAPNRMRLLRQDAVRHYILLGAASALRPLLEVLQDDPGGVPWGPTSPERSALADQHLVNCGRLALLQRLAALERYGLAEAKFHTDDYLVLKPASDDDDIEERKAGAWLGELARSRLSAAESRMAAMKVQIAARIDNYSSVTDGWFVQYDPDWATIEYHRDYATIYAAGTAEADALPGQALIGGRSFTGWNEASLSALGRLLHHIACATRLKATTPTLELRNLLTVLARKDDVAAVWRQSGETKEWADRIMAGLTLDAESAAMCERDHELPLPYYIDFGKHFVLLPMFGGLMNAHAGLVWHLRRSYRQDWDRAVDGREHVFRTELSEVFPPPRYVITNNSIRLRRADGTELTDVDAVVLDRRTGSLALIQLKWPDIHGRSLAERNSRRMNLLKANDWVSRVSGWVGARSSAEVAKILGLGAAGPRAPIIVVIGRHTVRFSGESTYDPRGQWISWPELVQLRARSPQGDLLRLLVGRKPDRARPRRRPDSEGTHVHHLPGLTVEVHSP